MNKTEKLIDIHFNGQVKIGSSEKIEKDEYHISYSKFITDYYWNFAFLKSTDIDLQSVWQNIKLDMEKLNRQPALYLMSNMDNSKIEKQLENCHLEKLYTDVWMTIENPENFRNYESKIETEISRVKSDEQDEFIDAVMKGFSSDDPQDPYGTLPEEYRAIYKLKFLDETYHKLEYCGKHKGEILTKLGIKTVCVQTEKGFYTEEVYKSMGFQEVMLGNVYGEKKKIE